MIATPNPRFRFRGREGSKTDEAVVRETWTENVYQLFESDFDDTGILVDVGANIGAVTVYAASLGATVVAVEPEPNNRALLEQNITLNKVAHKVTVLPVAVSNERGEGWIPDGHGDSRLSSDTVGTRVDVFTLADVIPEQGCDVLKVDAEGAEYDMFTGVDVATLNKVRYVTLEFDAAPDPVFGLMVAKLAHVFNIHMFGSPERGGYLFGKRY